MLTPAFLLVLGAPLDTVGLPVDTVAVVAAAWAASAEAHRGLRAAVLAMPPAGGARADRRSLAATLRTRGVRMRTDTAAVGPDTVVYRVVGIERASAGPVRVHLQSRWERRTAECSFSSGNTETWVVTCARRLCRATPGGPVTHGDTACRPLSPPDP